MRVIGRVLAVSVLLSAPLWAGQEQEPAPDTNTEADAISAEAEGNDSPEIVEVKELAAELGAFDLETWTVVGDHRDHDKRESAGS